MSVTGTVGTPAQSTPVSQAVLEQQLKLQHAIKRGAGWLMTVAIFSVVNSGLMLSDAKLHFIVGLGVTQIADGMAKAGGTAGGVAGFVVSLCVAALFMVFWKFAREGQQWAFITAMVLYGLDGLIFLGFGLWLDLAFHAFALFNIYKGLAAVNQQNQLNQQGR